MTVNYRIRKYKSQDLSKVKKLVAKWYWSFFTDNHYAKFVAVSGDAIVGVAVTSITLGTANLDFIFVSNDSRLKGMGRSLLRQVEQNAHSKRAEGLGVNCVAENKIAQRFYKKNRFQRVGQVYNYFSNGNLQVFFWKRI